MMNNIKYTYWPIDNHCVIGDTDLDGVIGLPIDPNGYTLLLCVDGWMLVDLNFKRTFIRPGTLIMIPYDMSFIPIRRSNRFRCKYISVTTELADDALTFIASPDFWNFLYYNPRLECTDTQLRLLLEWFEQTKWIFTQLGTEEGYSLLVNNLYNLFMCIYHEVKSQKEAFLKMKDLNRGTTLLNQFEILVSRYCTRCREVKFYAEKLNISTDYLHKLSNEAYNASPKQLIDRQVIVAMKIYLMTTDLSISNIAAELHFEDTSYMCRYFRKKVGVSPLEFRNSSKKY